MNNGTRLFCAALFLSGAGLAGATAAGAAPGPNPAAVPPTVLRGSAPAAVPSAGNGDPGVVVLRGPPLPAAPPACPKGSIDEPGSGCVLPVYAYEPYEYGYEPYPYYFGFGGVRVVRRHLIRRRREFRPGLARGIRLRAVPLLGVRAARGFGPRFGRIGGLGRH